MLSPTLFNLFINDLWENMPKEVELYAFADDIVIFVQGQQALDKAIKALETWCKTNLLEVNKSKSGLMFIRQDRRTPLP